MRGEGRDGLKERMREGGMEEDERGGMDKGEDERGRDGIFHVS